MVGWDQGDSEETDRQTDRERKRARAKEKQGEGQAAHLDEDHRDTRVKDEENEEDAVVQEAADLQELLYSGKQKENVKQQQ